MYEYSLVRQLHVIQFSAIIKKTHTKISLFLKSEFLWWGFFFSYDPKRFFSQQKKSFKEFLLKKKNKLNLKKKRQKSSFNKYYTTGSLVKIDRVTEFIVANIIGHICSCGKIMSYRVK